MRIIEPATKHSSSGHVGTGQMIVGLIRALSVERFFKRADELFSMTRELDASGHRTEKPGGLEAAP